MNLSVFDQGLGSASDYGPAYRDVVIQIDGIYQSYLPSWNVDNNAAGIQQTLNSKGWLIEQVANISTAWFPEQSHFTYVVYAVVGNAHSDGEVVSNIQRDLAGFFNISGVSVLSTPYNGPSGQQSSFPAVNYLPATPGVSLAPAGSSFLDSLGTGLGISTPIVLLAGGVLLLIVLRR